MSAAEEAPDVDLVPELDTILDLVTELRDVAPMGRRGRQILFALARAAQDVPTMSGLVLDGQQVPDANVEREYAACGCRNGKHPYTRDAPWFGRSGWTTDRAAAEAKKDRLHGHIMTRATAFSRMELLP